MSRFFKTLGLFVFVVACITQNPVYAQSKQVTGTVTSSENNQPLAGVTVTEKGTRVAAVTDQKGFFWITVDEKTTTLIFSIFSIFEAFIAGKSVLDVRMDPESKAMTDVVVIGYQTIKRKDLLASVSSVSAKDLKDIPVNSAAEALNGRLAGVTATTAEGSPDAAIQIVGRRPSR
jgi:hypothetical protein